MDPRKPRKTIVRQRGVTSVEVSLVEENVGLKWDALAVAVASVKVGVFRVEMCPRKRGFQGG